MKEVYKRIVTILFFILFATPILSPSIMEHTIYLYLIIPLLDFEFIKSVFQYFKENTNKKSLIMFGSFLLIGIILLKIDFIIEIISIVELILYLLYLYKCNLFKYLYLAVNINIFIAIIQFILYYINPSWAFSLGPTSISNFLWGEYATPTFTNMLVNNLGIVKVSGWSREAGFFSSLVIITTIVYSFIDKNNKKSIFQYMLFGIGCFISISKVSCLLILVIPLILFKKYIDKIPYVLSIISVILFGIIFSNILLINNQYNNEYTKNYETFSHRFSGYTIMTKLDFKELIFGIDSISNLKPNVKEEAPYLQYIYRFKEFCGLPGMIIHQGLIMFVLFMYSLKKLKFKATDFYLITIMTLTVNYTTLTSFVILGYFMIIKLNQRESV